MGENVTIVGGAGNDYLDNGVEWEFNHGTVYIYGGGNDTIERFRNDDNFLIIEGHTWETIGVEDTGNLLVNVLDGTETFGSITLKDYYALTPGNINILSSKKEFSALNLIFNDADNQTLKGTDGKDVITNTGKNVSIVGGAGNDVIFNGTEEGGVINCDEGDDIVDNGGSNVLIKGGEGDDNINNNGAGNSTIDAAKATTPLPTTAQIIWFTAARAMIPL